MTMMNWIVTVLTFTRVVQGMVPEIGTTGTSDVQSTLPTRTLMGRRALLVQQCSAMWGQCGGEKWTGATCCSKGTCQVKNQWYSQCKEGGDWRDGTSNTISSSGGGSSDETSNLKVESTQESGSSPPPPSSSGGGEFSLCINGESETYGPTVAQREWPNQGSAVTVTKKDNGKGSCSWEEYAGGFDGYPSPEIGDGHEKGMDMAIEQMFPGNHAKQTKFLQEMIRIGNPIDLDFPEDEKRADNYERMNNIEKLNGACSQLISVTSC